jgi:hypothetical protein
MSIPNVSAHPMLEPLDYDLTPEAAGRSLRGDLLDLYTLLWNAGLATVVDGPALRREELVIQLTSPVETDGSDFGLALQAVAVRCVEPGWGDLLPSELTRAQASNAVLGAAFPKLVDEQLTRCGPPLLDDTGRRVRGIVQCQSLVALVDNTKPWQADVALISDPSLSIDLLLERMADQGVGRPSTYADRLAAALENDLVCDRAGEQLAVGEYGHKVLAALSAMPTGTTVDAQFSADLESALHDIEADPSIGGAALRHFCVRALGTEPALADWLDELAIEGESLNEALARAEARLPQANSWDAFTLPYGMSPECLVRNPEAACQVRDEVDQLLATPNRGHWKRYTPRRRAASRLAAIGLSDQAFPADGLASRATRDIALRWWIDLAPNENPLTDAELDEPRAIVLAFDPDIKVKFADLALRAKHAL